MKRSIVCCSFLMLAFLFAQTSSASIGGVYTSTFQTGSGGGAAWSYVHAATGSVVTPTGGYSQYAGGSIFFRISNTDTFAYTFTDNNTAGLSDGDTLEFDIAVDLFQHNTNTIVGELELSGSFVVGGLSSAGFSHGLSNISGTGSAAASGLAYEITLSADSGSFLEDDVLSGESFYQAGALAGPFNGISYVNGELIFAAWGNSWNTGTVSNGIITGNNTGTRSGSLTDDFSLGFDLYSRGHLVPEPGTIVCWTLLGLCGGGLAWRRRS